MPDRTSATAVCSMEKGSKTSIDWDIRFFRRYPKSIDFTFIIQGRSLLARTIDYSLSGIGIAIDDVAPPLTRGAVVSIDIDELNLHEKGKVAWVRKTPSSLRVGLLRRKPWGGSFRLYPLPDILIGLQRTLKTGILDVRRGVINKKVYIKAGNVICAASNYEKDRLGDVLLKSRKINKRQYDKAAEIKSKSGGSYTAILVHMGYLKPHDVIKAAELQTRRIIGSLFAMKDAEFQFVEGPLPAGDAITLNLSLADLLYRGLKQNADVKLLENYLLDSIVDFSSNPLNLFQDIHFTPADKAVISCVDGKTTIKDIIGRSPSGRVNPLNIIYALLEARFLKIKERHESPSGIRAGLILGPGKEGDSPPAEIDRLYTEYKSLDYYRILDVTRNSTTDEIRRAYYKAARKYHPDMHLHAPEDIKKKLVDIFSSITTACITLADPAKREQYDRLIARPDVAETPGLQHGSSDMTEEMNPPLKVAQPDSTGSSGNANTARLRFGDGKVAFWDKHFDEAARQFATAIYFDGSVPAYHYYYGISLGMLGKLKAAVQALNRANDLKPGDADILAELGHAYLKLGFPVRAKGYFDKAAQLAPVNNRVREGLELMRRKKTR
jgi:curved DNA-binding protein CbpA